MSPVELLRSGQMNEAVAALKDQILNRVLGTNAPLPAAAARLQFDHAAQAD